MTRPLSHHRTRLEKLLHDNAAAHVGKVTRIILDGIDERARKFIRVIRQAEKDVQAGYPRGSTIMLSIHGGEAAIEDLIRQAAWHREHGAERKVA